MIYYKVKFRLAKEEKANEIILTDYANYFEAAKDDFNEAGDKARVYKKILVQNIGATFIEIYFECATPLTSPTMAFRNYSKYIIDNYEETNDWITTSGNFLKGIEAQEINQSDVPGTETIENEVETLSDKEMIKEILDMCVYTEIETSEEKKNRIRTIEKIKAIILEYKR